MIRCPGCNTSLAADAVFCTHCGLSLSGGKQAEGASKIETQPDGTPGELAVIAIGRVIDGKYRVDRLIGEGGMGVVYAARSLHTDVDVVIKAVRPEFAHRKDIRDRTLAEGRALAHIDHPNVVQLKTIVVENDELLLVMQYIEGESLEDQIIRCAKQGQPMKYDEAIRIFRQVLDGVGAAHDEGVIHRDLKPANILIRAKDGMVKVTDFGIAKPIEDPEQGTGATKGIIGSVHYMAPEQVKGLKDLDRRCDVYALGILLFQMLTGRVPFDADNTYDIMRKQVDEPLPSILARRPDVPPALEGILQRACAKEREHRFASTAELKRAIDDIPSGYAATAAVPMYPAPGPTVPGRPVFATTGQTGPQAGQPTGQPVPQPMPQYGPVAAQTGTITGQAAELPPTQRDSGSKLWLLPVVGLIGAASVVTLLFITGVIGGDNRGAAGDGGTATPTTTETTTSSEAPETSPLERLSGLWASDTGRQMRAVVVGDKVEFQVVDASQFGAQGYREGEPRFLLHPLPDPDSFLVEDRIRPLPPAGESYDPAQAHSTCMAVWRDADGEPLRATLTGDRLDVDFGKIEPTAKNFVRSQGKVISCRGLEELPAKRLPQVLKRP